MFFQEIIVFLKQHIMLVCIWGLLLIMIIYTWVIYWIRKPFEISCSTAVFLINKKNALIIDVRNQHEYDSGYILNSINISFKDMKDNRMDAYQKCKDSPLIVIHNNHTLSFSIKKFLNKLGFSEVYILKGGVYSWKENNLPLLVKK